MIRRKRRRNSSSSTVVDIILPLWDNSSGGYICPTRSMSHFYELFPPLAQSFPALTFQTMCTAPYNVPPDSRLRLQRAAQPREPVQSATRAREYAISVPRANQQALDDANSR